MHYKFELRTYTFEGELEIRLFDNPCSRCRGYVQDVVQRFSFAELSCDNAHVFEHESMPTETQRTGRPRVAVVAGR